jgi:hypothetical protein
MRSTYHTPNTLAKEGRNFTWVFARSNPYDVQTCAEKRYIWGSLAPLAWILIGLDLRENGSHGRFWHKAALN